MNCQAASYAEVVHSAAFWCMAHCLSSQQASNIWIRSPDGTISTPDDFTSSIVPASTRETYGLAFRGTYSIAIFFAPRTRSPTPASNCCHFKYEWAVPGTWLSAAGSMRCSSFCGSPLAGMK